LIAELERVRESGDFRMESRRRERWASAWTPSVACKPARA